MWSERGESGRDSVGEGVPTPRLFLLLLRQLEHKQKKKTEVNNLPRSTSIIISNFIHVNIFLWYFAYVLSDQKHTWIRNNKFKKHSHT